MKPLARSHTILHCTAIRPFLSIPDPLINLSGTGATGPQSEKR